jgi:hypothetical protein
LSNVCKFWEKIWRTALLQKSDRITRFLWNSSRYSLSYMLPSSTQFLPVLSIHAERLGPTHQAQVFTCIISKTQSMHLFWILKSYIQTPWNGQYDRSI